MKQKVYSEHFQKKLYQDTLVKTGLDWNSQPAFPVAILSTLGRKQILSIFNFVSFIYTIHMQLFLVCLKEKDDHGNYW